MREMWANRLLPKALKSYPKFNRSFNLVTLVGGSPRLMFIGGGDSRSRGREFESQSGRYFLHLSKKYFWNSPRRNEKEAGDSPFYIFCFQIITISIWSLEDDPIATYFFNIWPFTTMILCVIAYFFPNAILS